MKSDQQRKRHPPEAYRFKPGKSGNPSGRPKAKPSVDPIQLMTDVLLQEVKMTTPTGTTKVVMLKAIFQRLASSAVKGDNKAAQILAHITNNFTLLYTREPDPAAKALIDEMLNNLRKHQEEVLGVANDDRSPTSER